MCRGLNRDLCRSMSRVGPAFSTGFSPGAKYLGRNADFDLGVIAQTARPSLALRLLARALAFDPKPFSKLVVGQPHQVHIGAAPGRSQVQTRAQSQRQSRI